MIDCRFWENTIWCGEVKRFNVTKPKTIHGFSTTGKTIFNIRGNKLLYFIAANCPDPVETLCGKGFGSTASFSGLLTLLPVCRKIITIKQTETMKLMKIKVPKKEDLRKPPMWVNLGCIGLWV
jgi:hypothetical protein